MKTYYFQILTHEMYPALNKGDIVECVKIETLMLDYQNLQEGIYIIDKANSPLLCRIKPGSLYNDILKVSYQDGIYSDVGISEIEELYKAEELVNRSL